MKKSKNIKKLRRNFVLCLAIGFGITIPLELSLAFIAKYYLNVEISIPNLLWIVVTSIAVGALVMAIISKRFLVPLTNLSTAMSKVAEGDFETQIETTS